MQGQEELSINNLVSKNQIGIIKEVELKDTNKIKKKGIKQIKVLNRSNSIHIVIQKFLIKIRLLNLKYK
jgi:hypothetical protein